MAPNDLAYEAGRKLLADRLALIGAQDACNGFTILEKQLRAGELIQVPTWVVLQLLGDLRANADELAREPATADVGRTLAAGRIIDVMTGGSFDWRARLDESDFLESADWLTALAYADAALSRAAPSSGHAIAEGERAALQEALHLAVCTLAFHGRDRGTDRQEKMLDELEELARKVDPIIRKAISHVKPTSEPTDEQEAAKPRCGCKPEIARRVIIDHGTCGMGGCPYGGDF